TLNMSGRTFREEFEDFERWLRDSVRDAGLSWQRAAVYERPFGPAYERGWIPGRETANLDSFEDRFGEILATSEGGWVNFEVETVADDVLIVAVVWRPAPEGQRRTLPVSVNRSGFARAELELLSAEASRSRDSRRP